MPIRIAHAENYGRSPRLVELASMPELCQWINLQPRFSLAADYDAPRGWISPNTWDVTPNVRTPADASLDRLSYDLFAFATRVAHADILTAYDDYERIAWQHGDWIVTIVRLSRPVSWYGARVVAAEICNPLNPTILSNKRAQALFERGELQCLELDLVELPWAGETAVYHPGDLFFALPNDTMRAIYLRNGPGAYQDARA